MQSVPPRRSGWVRSLKLNQPDCVPTRYREVVLTASNFDNSEPSEVIKTGSLLESKLPAIGTLILDP